MDKRNKEYKMLKSMFHLCSSQTNADYKYHPIEEIMNSVHMTLTLPFAEAAIVNLVDNKLLSSDAIFGKICYCITHKGLKRYRRLNFMPIELIPTSSTNIDENEEIEKDEDDGEGEEDDEEDEKQRGNLTKDEENEADLNNIEFEDTDNDFTIIIKHRKDAIEYLDISIERIQKICKEAVEYEIFKEINQRSTFISAFKTKFKHIKSFEEQYNEFLVLLNEEYQ